MGEERVGSAMGAGSPGGDTSRVSRQRPSAVVVLLALLMALGAGPAGAAVVIGQSATPGAAPGATPGASGGVEVVAGGLENPRGFTWGPDGDIYVALAGSGGTSVSAVDSAQEEESGPLLGGATASVARIAGGCPVGVAGGLRSTRGMNGHTQGPGAVAFLGEQLYVLLDAGDDMDGAMPQQPNGVYAVEADGSTRLVADTSAWIDANPVAHIPYDKGELGETFAMLADASGNALWVLESNSGQVLRVTTSGEISRVADLSEGHPVPTGFALAPKGGVYVGFLTPAPYPNNGSKVVEVAVDGTVTDVWSGLTMVTALAVGADGALYAAEMATGNTADPPYVSPGTGRVVRQTGPSGQAEVVTGLDYPIAMAFGPDGGLYVGGPAFGAPPAAGTIARFEVGGAAPIAVDPARLPTPTCAAATPEAVPMATPAVPAATGLASPVVADDGRGATGALPVAIVEFSFAPAELTVPAGTTVVWTNLDPVPHTVTATEPGVALNSGNIAPGESFSFTFEEPGVYPYACSYHPSMTGRVVVE